jgi:acyl dehydratase
MPLRSAVVGEALAPLTAHITPRGALAFAAGIADDAEGAFDDTRPTFAASPMACVSLEWALVIAARNALLGVTTTEARRAVHAGQDSRFLAPLRPGAEVSVGGQVLEVRRTGAGALSTTRLDVTDLASGALISTSLSTALYRGVAVEGEDRSIAPAPDPAPSASGCDVIETPIPLDRGFAHRYSECAAIWNPIHTERAVAREAGLAETIVHGTALWALAGRILIGRFAPDRPGRLTRLSGRFSAMVPAGTPIVVRHATAAGRADAAVFTVLNAQGREAVSQGFATFAAP